jgi:sulfur-oxidizing protein SoxY
MVKKTRRALLTAVAGAAACAALPSPLRADDDALDLVRLLTGRTPTESDRVRLSMPSVFPTGSAVPLTLDVDSPMTEGDCVQRVHVLAPRNPIVEIGTFHFTPGRSIARVSTRVRLAEPQHVLAVAEMSDGTLLMSKVWVEVATNGCT